MAIKLRLRFKGQLFPLALKAAVFGILYSFAGARGFALIPASLFIVGSSILYMTPILRSGEYLFSFAALMFTAMNASLASGRSLYTPLIAIAAILFFFVLLGLKNFYFMNRSRWHLWFILLINYFVVFLFASHAGPFPFFLKAALIFIVMYCMFREYFFATISRVEDRTSKKLGAAIVSLIAVETFWITSLLPLTAIGSSGIVFLVMITAMDLLIRQQQKIPISRRAILLNITFLSLLVLIIFAATKWSV